MPPGVPQNGRSLRSICVRVTGSIRGLFPTRQAPLFSLRPQSVGRIYRNVSLPSKVEIVLEIWSAFKRDQGTGGSSFLRLHLGPQPGLHKA